MCQALRNLSGSRPRVVIIGVGNNLRGDDAAGIAVAHSLLSIQGTEGPSLAGGVSLLVIDAGSAPENFTGIVRCFVPELVLLVDAAQMDDVPGTVRWLEWQDTAGLSASTHSLPLHIVAAYMATEMGCAVALIGIQPSATDLGAPISPAVQQAVHTVVTGLLETLNPNTD